MNQMLKIEEFIEEFNKKYDGSQYFFLNGGCKIFANILKELYGGEILDYLGHYVLKRGDYFYDITGKLEGIKYELCNGEGACRSNDEFMNSYKNIYGLVSKYKRENNQ